jgi:hypothetical protein
MRAVAALLFTLSSETKLIGASQIGLSQDLFNDRSDAFHLAQNSHSLWLKTTSSRFARKITK